MYSVARTGGKSKEFFTLGWSDKWMDLAALCLIKPFVTAVLLNVEAVFVLEPEHERYRLYLNLFWSV